jgi:hypothetical protein
MRHMDLLANLHLRNGRDVVIGGGEGVLRRLLLLLLCTLLVIVNLVTTWDGTYTQGVGLLGKL